MLERCVSGRPPKALAKPVAHNLSPFSSVPPRRISYLADHCFDPLVLGRSDFIGDIGHSPWFWGTTFGRPSSADVLHLFAFTLGCHKAKQCLNHGIVPLFFHSKLNLVLLGHLPADVRGGSDEVLTQLLNVSGHDGRFLRPDDAFLGTGGLDVGHLCTAAVGARSSVAIPP